MEQMQHNHHLHNKPVFPPLEIAVIVVTMLVLLLLTVQRLNNSMYLRNAARVNDELHRICDLEHRYFVANEKFGYAEDIGFKEKYPFSGIVYSINVDSVGFTGFAREATGHDAFGDNRPGNEYYSVDVSDNVTHQTFPPE